MFTNYLELTLMKGDKVVKGIKQLSDFALFLKRRKRYFSHTELVVIEVQTNATLLQLHNQLLKSGDLNQCHKSLSSTSSEVLKTSYRELTITFFPIFWYPIEPTFILAGL